MGAIRKGFANVNHERFKMKLKNFMLLLFFVSINSVADYQTAYHERPYYQFTDETTVNEPDYVNARLSFVIDPLTYFDEQNLNQTGVTDMQKITQQIGQISSRGISQLAKKYPEKDDARYTLAIRTYIFPNSINSKVGKKEVDRAKTVYAELLKNTDPRIVTILTTDIVNINTGERKPKSEVLVYSITGKVVGSSYDDQFSPQKLKVCNKSKCYTQNELMGKIVMTVSYESLAQGVNPLGVEAADAKTQYGIGVANGSIWCDTRISSKKQCQAELESYE